MEETFIYRDVYIKIVCVDASKHMYVHICTNNLIFLRGLLLLASFEN